MRGGLLSKVGKQVLIKAVFQATPTYSMSVFRLLIEIYNEVESIIAQFWWSKGAKQGIHWKNWKALCQHKSKGGLGFRELISFNKALLAKQGWCMLQSTNYLIARMLKATYFPTTDFLSA
ncbi:unnamed protein product [Prunus armeniaca]